MSLSLSLNHRIFRTFLLVGLASLLPKAAMVGRDLILASHFGTGDEVDAFLVALSLPSLVVQVLVQAFASSLIPVFMLHQERHGTGAALDVAARAASWGGLGLLVGTGLLWLGGPWIIAAACPGFPPEKQDLVLHYYRILLCLVPLQGFVIIWSALLNAVGRFAWTSLCPVITPLCVLLGISLFSASHGMHSAVLFTVLGAGLEVVVLAVLMVRRSIPLWRSAAYGDVRTILHQALPMVIGMMLANGNLLVDQFFASLVGGGGVAALMYGNKVPSFLMSLAALPLGTAVLPHFSRHAAQRDWRGLRHALTSWSLICLAATVPIMLLAMLWSEPMVHWLFERGKFASADTRLVAEVQMIYLAQIPAYLLGYLGTRMLTALSLNRVIMVIAGLGCLVNGVLDYLLMEWFGLPGIAASTVVTYTLTSVLVLGFLFIRLKRQP